MGPLPALGGVCQWWLCSLPSCQVLMSSILHLCILMPGLVFSLCALNVVTDSMLTKAVSAADTGQCHVLLSGILLSIPSDAQEPGGLASWTATSS